MAARPNIVFMLTDDQGYGDLACLGNPAVKTPNLDRLHEQSLRLTDFHVSPTCAPTRKALMTGRHEFRSGVTHTIFEQVSADRRFVRGLQFGVAWTWSKAMDYADANADLLSTLIDPKVWNYGRAGYDRTHVLKINFTYELPNGSGVWRNGAARVLLDRWQISGIATMQSGAPLGIGLAFVNSVDTTGSPTDGARVVVLKNAVLPKSERTFARNFDTSAFAPPAVGSFGNAPKDVIRGPGLNNWDLMLFKNIPIHGERVQAQWRGEFYNAFNHTQFTAWNTAATFDVAGRQSNVLFGQAAAAAPARRIQLAMRVSF